MILLTHVKAGFEKSGSKLCDFGQREQAKHKIRLSEAMLLYGHFILSRIKMDNAQTHITIAYQINVSGYDFSALSFPAT
jgi:hypothetical protein